MSTVISKLQVSIPRAVARRYGIGPGSHVFFEPAGEMIRLRPERRERTDASEPIDRSVRLRMFDAASERQRERNDGFVRAEADAATSRTEGRGWTREALYERGLPR